MRRNGINYDVGMFAAADRPSRERFDPAQVRRELEVIARDLHCDTVRIFGQNPDRLRVASEHAIDQGLEVWFSPDLHNADARRTLDYLAECARIAERLRRRSPSMVFVVGRELTFFMRGLVTGDDAFARMRTFSSPWRLLSSTLLRGSFPGNLKRFLARAAETVREHFGGPVTYAAGTWEPVDWGPFDIVAVDHYRDARNRDSYLAKLRSYLVHGKPVVVTEFGSCAFDGAADLGALGWTIVDWRSSPPAIKGDHRRDEGEQAVYLTELLDLYEAEGVDGAMVFTFASYNYPWSPDPRHDLDLAAYGVVRCLPEGSGTAYPGMPWEPKRAFTAVAEHYATG